MKKVWIEICNDAIRKTGIKGAISDGWFNVWTPERIKGAFSFGHGTMKDFDRFRRDNSPRYCTIIEIEEADLERLYPLYAL